jgi:hypothetical protein
LATLPAWRGSCAEVEFGQRRLVSTRRRIIELELPGFGAEWVVRGEKGVVIPDTRWANRRLQRVSRDIACRQSRPITGDRPVRVVRSDRSCHRRRQGGASGRALLFGVLTIGIVVTGSGAATMLGHRSRSCLARGGRVPPPDVVTQISG